MDNPFSFGGGMLNGGLSSDAMDLLRGIFSFDYMGAAEFEFGAVPKALQGIAARSDRLAGWSFTIPLAKVAKNFREKGPAPKGSATVYVLADESWRPEVEDRIRGWAKEPYGGLKETTRLSSTLRPVTEWDGETVGWLELDNGFFFFTDEAMWEATCDLFGVTA